MSEDRDKLKQLLLSEEIAQIEALRKLLEDQQKFSEKVSDVLDQATDLTIQKNPHFQKKFSKIDSKSFARHIKANKQTFIDALLPIIGPMIRQSVTNAIRRFVADINRTLETGFNLKWRWQALRSGIPFEELVFNNTIQYQVQQIFLIDNETGLLIEYAGQEHALLQDKEAMSAMLTAIQDFVKDSINKDSEGLSAAELGEQLLWLIKGNHANLAVVVKGAPTNRLREKLADACEEIHVEFSKDLHNQEKWNNNPELKVQLESLLLTKSQSDDQNAERTINFWPWIFLITALIGWMSWHKYQQNKEYQQRLERLENTPGFVLQQLIQNSDHFLAVGLQDPHADLSDLPVDIVVKSTPFISLEDTMIGARVKDYLDNKEIDVTVNNGVVTLTGTQSLSSDLPMKIANLNLLPGVEHVDDQLRIQLSLEQQFLQFLEQNPPPTQTTINQTPQGLAVKGHALAPVINPYLQKAQAIFEHVDTNLLAIHSTEELQDTINNTHISLINPVNLNQQQKDLILKVIESFNLLATTGEVIKLKIIPQSDCQGTIVESNINIKNRAFLVEQFLLASGFQEDNIMTEMKYCDQISGIINTDLLAVSFEVVE
ncbi:MAG: BON domain-containing protein [Marinicella sp.]